MTDPHSEPTLDDVIEPTEQTHPDHREHGKTPKHVSGPELAERTRHEAEQVQATEDEPAGSE